jgi:hypothetical protein
MWVDLFKIQGFISKRHKPMLNGLWVDFYKTQGLILQRTHASHNLDCRLIHSKHRDSFVKVF